MSVQKSAVASSLQARDEVAWIGGRWQGGFVEPEDMHQNPLVFQRWLATAGKIERDPALLSIPLANIERWMASGNLGNLEPLRVWHKLIQEARSSPEGMRRLLQLLRDDSEDARYMKSCSPFPGVLDCNEMDQFRCAWVH